MRDLPDVRCRIRTCPGGRLSGVTAIALASAVMTWATGSAAEQFIPAQVSATKAPVAKTSMAKTSGTQARDTGSVANTRPNDGSSANARSVTVGPAQAQPANVATASQAASKEPDGANAKRQTVATILSIVMVGDTGFAPHRARVHPKRVTKHGRSQTFVQASSGVDALIDGDINFANLETVVTRDNAIGARGKTFTFRTHPNGIRHLMERGFNLFALANNHALDHGRAGAVATMREMTALGIEARKNGQAYYGHAGVGRDLAETIAPALFTARGTRVAFSAMGIGAGGLFPSDAADGKRAKAGQLSINDPRHRALALGALAAPPADLRLLSLHAGIERNPHVLSSRVAQWRAMTKHTGGPDIIIGHHAHVAQGVELVDGKLIAYGLGNFLHQGMADMTPLASCLDYGLVLKATLVRRADALSGRTVSVDIAAVEAVPLTNMQFRPRPLRGKAAAARIALLNGVSARLDSPAQGATGVRFVPQDTGRGLYCAASRDDDPAALSELCQPYREAVRKRGVKAAPVARGCSSGARALTASRGGSSRSRSQSRSQAGWWWQNRAQRQRAGRANRATTRAQRRRAARRQRLARSRARARARNRSRS
ncbi:MAG: CapA family protein, partial [Pseudomonadota bacterium]